MKKLFLKTIALVTILLSVDVSLGQSFGMDPGSFSAYMYTHQTRDSLEKSHKQIFGQTIEESLGSKELGATKPTFTPPAQKADVAGDLAGTYPIELRPQAKSTFVQMLASYKKLAAQFGIPQNDLAGAVAAFIAGSYMAYNLVEFPDQNFKPLVDQMRTIITRSPALLNASAKEKQELHDRLAILGMFSAATFEAINANAQHPNRDKINANLKDAGKNYLEAFLGTPASRVQITGQGLMLK